jgi:autotransporter translocation and assembly factor TamB
LISKLLRFTRIALAALALIGIVALTLFALFGEKTLRTEVERRLAESLKRPVTVGSMSVNLAARVIELRDVVIPGLPASKRPTLVAPRVRIALSFRSLFTSRILLRGFELERPQIAMQVFPDGTTDLPGVASAGGPPARDVWIGKLVVSKGELFLNDQQIPVEIALPNFEARLDTDLLNVFKGSVSAGPGPMRFGDLPAEDASLALAVQFKNSALTIDSGTFTTAGTKLSLAGTVDLRKEPKGEIRFTGPLDLETLDQNVVSTGFGLKGVVQTQAVLSISGKTVKLDGDLRGQRLTYDSITVDSFSSGLTWESGNLHFRRMALEALFGKAALDVDVPKTAPTRVTGRLEGMSAEPLLRWLFDYTTAGLGARVTGPIDLTIPRGAANRLSGTGDFLFTGDPASGEPLSGRFPFKATDGVITVTGARLEVPKTAVSLDGTIQPDRRLALDVRLLSESLASTDALGVRLRTAFGTPNAAPLGASGNGTLLGRVTGTMQEPVFTGTFMGTSVTFLGVSWGAVDWAGSVSPLDLRSDRLVAVRGGARVEMTGTQRLGAKGVDDAIDLNLKIRDWPAKDLLRVVGSEIDVEAPVSGTMRLTGALSKPLGEGALQSASGKASGVAFKGADLKLRFEGEALRVESLKAGLGGGEVLVTGRLTEANGVSSFDGDVDVSEVELADLGLQEEDAPMVGGHVTGRITVSGPLEKPRVKAHLESKRVFYGDEGIGAVVMDIASEGDGILNVTGRSDSPRFSADVTGTIESKAPYQSRLEVKLTNARLDPVLRALGSRFQNAVVVTASANARIQGPLGDPGAVTAQVRDGKLRIAVPEYAIEAASGSVIDVEGGAIRIAGLNLTGEGTSIAVSGRLAIKPEDTNDLAVTGRADMRVLSGFLREWRLRGSATLRSQISGTRAAPRLSGGLDIEDGALRLRSFPQGLDDLNGRVVFSETQMRVAGLEGRFGGGRVSVSGQMGFGGAVPSSFDFFFNGDSLGLRYPEGLRATFGAALRLQGTMESHWLTGNLNVSKALWTRKYTITSELLGPTTTQASFAPGSSSLKPSAMHLDIAIRAPGTLRVDNNLADLAAKADLTLTGSPTEPQLLGRVELERGKVYFSGNTYEIRKGVANFSNPREINPVFDIEADTRVRSYRLTLQANGTFEHVSTRITSDPPLTSPQIASLLTGGDENDIANVSGSQGDFKTLGSGGVNQLASSVLDDTITGPVAQGVGLSRLSIDTGFFGRTGYRVTVGKRVTRDIEVVYSGFVSGGNEKLFTVEYSLSNRFSLLGSWKEPGGFGVDARTRFVLGKK